MNLGGNKFDEYINFTKILEENDVKIRELNISCPNINSSGMPFGSDLNLSYELVKDVRKVY